MNEARELVAGDKCPECLRPCHTGTFYSAQIPPQAAGAGIGVNGRRLASYKCECGLMATTKWAGGVMGIPLRIVFTWLREEAKADASRQATDSARSAKADAGAR